MKRWSNTLFWVGLVVSGFAFLTSQSQRLQSLIPVVAPSYAEAVAGKTRLLKTGVLEPNDTGFDVLSNRFLALLAAQNAPEALRGVSVVKFSRLANSIRLPGKGSDDEVGLSLEVSLSNGQVLPWSSVNLEKQIAPLKDRGIVLFSSILFVAGILIQILSRRFKESRPEKANTTQPEPNKAPEPTPVSVTPRATEGDSK